jgi:hypothetical protein
MTARNMFALAATLLFGSTLLEALRVVADAGRSRWRGLFAGWLASLPVYAVVCQNKSYECDEGGVANLVGVIVGAIVGWPKTTEVYFP